MHRFPPEIAWMPETPIADCQEAIEGNDRHNEADNRRSAP
jgi:hypothetical protein